MTEPNHDVSLPPSPDGGWSRDCVTLSRALAVPPTTSATVQAAGVLDASGAHCRHSATWRGTRPMMTAPAIPTGEVARLPGRHLYAGQLWAHFGHFLCESLARLWALDHVPPVDGIVFLPKRPTRTETLKGYQREMLALLGIDLPVHVLTEPTEVEELVVPGQGFGLGQIVRGTPETRAFFAARFGLGIQPDGPERLYLSRSRLGGREGTILSERRLETNLALDGYEAFHPQRHPISTQIARYRAARRVIGPDGSAFHLVGFVARPEQDVAVILRRTSAVPKGLVQQIAAFTGRTPLLIGAVTADWTPEKHGRPGRYSHGQIDFPRLGDRLAEAGLIAHRPEWELPRWRDGKAEIARRSRAKGIEFTRMPRDLSKGQPAWG